MFYTATKRTVDAFLSSLGLIVLAPLLASVTIAVRAKLGAPVLFSQERAGQGGRPFTLYKFRTMTSTTDASGHLLADGARLTSFGALLRSWSLDELPTLWNVLCGDMSLVGPRPLPTLYLPRYSATQARRHEVRPGVTGWAQVHGRNDISWTKKLELDVWYVDHCSLSLDARILGKTVFAVLRREGIAKTGHATTEEFLGDENG